jgi:hypothetical protein
MSFFKNYFLTVLNFDSHRENFSNKKRAAGTDFKRPKHQRMEAASAGNGTIAVYDKC